MANTGWILPAAVADEFEWYGAANMLTTSSSSGVNRFGYDSYATFSFGDLTQVPAGATVDSVQSRKFARTSGSPNTNRISVGDDADPALAESNLDNTSYGDSFKDSPELAGALDAEDVRTGRLRARTLVNAQSNNFPVEWYIQAIVHYSTGPAAPAVAPNLHSATWTGAGIDLSLDDGGATDEDGFRIERREDGGAWAEIATVATPGLTSYSDATATTAGVLYEYRVRQYNAGGDSPYSATQGATPTPPAAPTGPLASFDPANAARVWAITWDPVALAVGYDVEVETAADLWSTLASPPSNAASWDRSGLPCYAPDAERFRIRARNAAGVSPWTIVTGADALPTSPTGADASLSTDGQSVAITWTPLCYSGARVAIATDAAGPFETLVDLGDPGSGVDQHVHNDLAPYRGQTVHYRIRTLVGGRLSPEYAQTPGVAIPDPAPLVAAVLAGRRRSCPMIPLKHQSAAVVSLGPFVDPADGVTPSTALSLTADDVRLAKAGGPFAAKHEPADPVHDEAGWYSLQLDATDLDTVGRLRIAIAPADALPVWLETQVLPASVYDSLFVGSDRLPVEAAELAPAALTQLVQDDTGQLAPAAGSVAELARARAVDLAAVAGQPIAGPEDLHADLTALSTFDPAVDRVIVMTNEDKTGYQLAATGLDAIPVTPPAGRATNFRQMVVQLWRRFFARATMTATELRTYADDGVTVVTTQAVADDGATQTQEAA